MNKNIAWIVKTQSIILELLMNLNLSCRATFPGQAFVLTSEDIHYINRPNRSASTAGKDMYNHVDTKRLLTDTGDLHFNL